MMEVQSIERMFTFVSSNSEKIMFATQELEKLKIPFVSANVEMEEIQSDSIVAIATHKAKEAFSALHTAVVVSDHGWDIPSLGGFPGAYMKYMNEWLTAGDLLALMHGKENRRAILNETLCYFDGDHLETFSELVKGEVLLEPQGSGLPGQQVISLSSDKRSIAAHLNEGSDPVD